MNLPARRRTQRSASKDGGASAGSLPQGGFGSAPRAKSSVPPEATNSSKHHGLLLGV